MAARREQTKSAYRRLAQGDRAERRAPRKQFHGQADTWKEFVAAYARELKAEPAKSAAADLCERAKHEPVTLLYAARDENHNNAVALKDWLERAP